MRYHRYQEAVLSRYESACRDLGLVDEQKDWLLDLLMAEKDRVDQELAASGVSKKEEEYKAKVQLLLVPVTQ